MCEVNVDTIRRAHKICPVTAIQSEYHLMHRMVETNGVLELCEDLGIGFVPYSPLNRGFLGGMINEYTKFDVTNDNRRPCHASSPKPYAPTIVLWKFLTLSAVQEALPRHR